MISSAVSHDLLRRTFVPELTDKQSFRAGRLAAAGAILLAGYLGYNPPGFVAQVVAFAFGLAAASLFPALLLGIFSLRMNAAGAISGMLTGLLFTLSYIVAFKGVFMEPFFPTRPRLGCWGFRRKASEPSAWCSTSP